MRIYHFVNQKFGLEDLQNKRLKIATFSDLNDPFELLGPGSGDREIRRAFEKTKDKLSLNRGMLCFSKHWKNPVQWSHYADKHRGLCLGFDMPDKYLTPVTYCAKRLEPDINTLRGGGGRAQTEMLRILSTKYSHWRYENEVRCFIRLSEQDASKGVYFCHFSKSLALREVIVGHNSTLSRAKIGEAIGENKSEVSICKARLAFRSFRIVRQRNEKLWN
jgi:hypothetical protein